MTTELAKLIATLGSFFLAVFGCSSARWLNDAPHSFSVRDRFVSFANTMAAGVLLAASLTHMLPDATSSLQGVSTYPVAPFLVGSAFCFLLVVGEVVNTNLPTREPHVATDCAACEASFALWPRWGLMPSHGCEGVRRADVLGHEASVCDHDPRRRRGDYSAETAATASVCSQLSPEHRSFLHSTSSCCRIHRHADHPCTEMPISEQGVVDEKREAAPKQAGRLDEHLLDTCHVRGVGGGAMAEVKAFLLFSALCFHSVMEGLGMGSAPTQRKLLPVVLAILAHKGLAAFALGSSLSKSDIPAWKFWTFVAIFSTATPVGVLLGGILTGSSGEDGIASGICIALASGTFLQVSAMELLPRALAEQSSQMLSCIGLVLGYLAMSGLAVWC